MTEKIAAEPVRRGRYGVPSIVLAVVSGVLYAYVLWEAIGNLVQLPQALPAGTVPWWLLILDVLLPLVAYLLAFLLGRRRRLPSRAALFLIGLCLLACSTIGSIAFVQTH
jgi:hypothetical protein